MKYLYTWKDVEIEIEAARKDWPLSWKRVQVYQDEILILKDSLTEKDEKEQFFFKDLLGNYYSSEENAVCIKEFDVKLFICYEAWEEDELQQDETQTVPLFRSVFYSDEIKLPDKMPLLPGASVIAFHSYKGGVGRTLSLISLLKEISSVYGNKKRVLVIDSDLEAPGLTWAVEKSMQFPFSYIDFLSLLRVYGENEKTIRKAAELMMENTIYLETEKERTLHYFLPAYRKESQLALMYARPESFLELADNRFLISEAVSKLGKVLRTDLVLIDLRAGISEISAPFLFDSRVDKYFISSTSLQSIQGIRKIQEQVYKKSRLSLMNSKILMTMVPKQLSEDIRLREIDKLVEIPEELYDKENATFLRDEYIITVGFDSELIYQGNFEEICQSLTGTAISGKMRKIAKEIFSGKNRKKRNKSVIQLEEKKIRECLKRLNEKVNVTAEAGNAADMLLTDSIQQLIKSGKKELPSFVVLGAKGSGKTYLYKQLVYKQRWNRFVNDFEEKENRNYEIEDAVFLPVLSTAHFGIGKRELKSCLESASGYFGENLIDSDAFLAFKEDIKNFLEQGKTSKEWKQIWISQILAMFSGRFQSLKELNHYLLEKRKRVIFLVDGLDDLVNCVYEKPENARTAIQTLCVDIIHELDWMDNRNIGMIIFLRKDIAEDAIKINYQQFRDQYARYELNWSQEEALRLALWMAGKAIPELQIKENENILLLSKGEVEKKLELLWGEKLGECDSKEARSSRWILAALSDFNGQLQARDIMRFLENASEVPEVIDFHDRYIMPRKIRSAIEPCAKEKFNEIGIEMPKIYEILKKFDEKEDIDKVLPLDPEEISLSIEEMKKLEQQGFIKVSEEKYYLPEIIRLALGFRYRKGARPKVLSMIIK